MIGVDPIKDIEQTVHGLTAEADRYAKPIKRRYPILFALFTIFGISAIFYGFELVFNRIEIFVRYPALLIGLGLLVLVLTGSLYRALHKNS
jgi:hypothetical protein